MNNVVYDFTSYYKKEIDFIHRSIQVQKSICFVGINGIGKNILFECLKLNNLQQNHKEKHIYLSFKDRFGLDITSVLTEIINSFSVINSELQKPDFINEFTVYKYLSEILDNLLNEKLIINILDFQNLFNLPESFFDMLRNLRYYYPKTLIFYIFSEPHILKPVNTGVNRFCESVFDKDYKFMSLQNKSFMEMDLQKEENITGFNLSKYKNKIIAESNGLHGLMKAYVIFIRKNPENSQTTKLNNILLNNDLFGFWITEIINSLPIESQNILKNITDDIKYSNKYKKEIFYTWLVNLSIINSNGKLNFPVLKPYIQKIPNSKTSAKTVFLKNGLLNTSLKSVKLTEKEFDLMQTLINKKGKTITYDELGSIIWKENIDNFSLWALSQLIKRLRNKLKYVYLDPKKIVSIRGKGYMWEN